MYRNESVFCVITAGGAGNRMGLPQPKQFALLGGKPVLVRTAECFERMPEVDGIVLVVPAEYVKHTRELAQQYRLDKVIDIIAGEGERQQSVYAGLLAVPRHCGLVLIHDGVRPFPPEAGIAEALALAYEKKAALLAVPVKDTIKRVNNGIVESTPPRAELFSAQTPQIFRYEVALEAHQRAIKDGFIGSDDASLAERIGIKPAIAKGSFCNIKLTTPEDFLLAEQILKDIGDH